ncbi:TetR/AcrR family transcriptional regulator [Actinoalloteichus hymeniacidonis]|uniref:Transcriptional regulator, TetR family n=1 Tax=Actinoalloteichus hymeniacidonis TaxID=340345 RepID=A0AAC9HRX7_9PSEU|nr:TetR/AcrR family transcriptional regulator [Actinoalloteichus hymeniacidonis]AOS64323.1 transcriptional regulator, TetR family [Actinoalloteichus hymeniacidonis]MBB5907609.1 AcrR family transcriptional regulator [Actinoalloteichus hymeniacidonis]
MRADARRNREQIVAAALALFAKHGSCVSMEEIAAEAGVGVGTIYRRFPDRTSLLTEITISTLRILLADTELSATEEPSSEARLIRYIQTCSGSPLALLKTVGDLDDPEFIETRDALNEQLLSIITGGQAEGTIRTDIVPVEIVQLISTAVCRPGARPDDPLTVVLLDGLRVPGTGSGHR